MKLGIQLWSQRTSWPAFRDAALAAEAAGLDSVWTWDHLLAIFGPWEQPIFEGWSLLSATAAVTSRIRLGLLVGANTFRNPGLTAKLATTLDHVSGGRAVLGIGGAWFEREHDAFGFDETWGSGVGERLDRLDEAVGLIRRLLDGERVSHDGRFYTLRDALCEPRPLQAHLPILIGGAGPTKTLRTAARYADLWNASALTTDRIESSVGILAEHCRAEGRDPAAIELTVSFPIVIRDDVPAARAAALERFHANGVEDMGAGPHLAGPPSLIADELRRFQELGFTTVFARLPAPYDRETIDRLGEVRALLDG
ncbi:MAG TPA: TIGR03560 family F420-dependent LLM class oxidoreductase [Candidatus Limnocylindrales bacterium]|jgi:F420-dependent oxidoreductase-like protein|nr:TIGR03560 family F420-dependent LLM class oxidoreductase [Candidatus Limnocylindrales bacterium]